MPILITRASQELLEDAESAIGDMPEEGRAALLGLLDVIDRQTSGNTNAARRALYHEVNAPRWSAEAMAAWRDGQEKGITSGYTAGTESVTSFLRTIIGSSEE